MSEDEVRSYLESKGHGVLSMGVESRGHGFPISFSCDWTNDRLVLGFTDAPESKKQQFATATEEVTLTVYDYEDVDSWKSVVVTGTLHRTDEESSPDQLTPLFFVEEDAATGERRLADLDERERTWYELRIDDVSGRHSGAES